MDGAQPRSVEIALLRIARPSLAHRIKDERKEHGRDTPLTDEAAQGPVSLADSLSAIVLTTPKFWSSCTSTWRPSSSVTSTS